MKEADLKDDAGMVLSSDDVIEALRERAGNLLYENSLLSAQVTKLKRELATQKSSAAVLRPRQAADGEIGPTRIR